MNKRMHGKAAMGPAAIGLSRRDFLLLTGAAVTAAGASNSTAYAADVHQEENPPERIPITSVLPKNPTHNPGFNVRALPDGGLIVWARCSGGECAAYRLNGDGYCIWRLCDGTRDPARIAAEYEKATRRPGCEADAFLAELLRLGVVASGARVVTLNAVPAKG